jgi:hypothetical protein
VIELIVRMAKENPTWSRRRIAAELSKLGHDVSKDSVAKYLPRPAGCPRRPPSMTWGTFVRMHLAGTIAVDLLTVPTAVHGHLKLTHLGHQKLTHPGPMAAGRGQSARIG